MNTTDNREILHESRNIIDGRRGVLRASVNILDWVVPMPETVVPKKTVDNSFDYIPPETVPERPASQEAVKNSVAFSVSEPTALQQPVTADQTRIDEIRARADAEAESAAEGIKHVSEAN